MELAYLYIKEYHNLKNVELNFSQKIKVNFDKENKKLFLGINDNIELHNFWGKNINNLTMIVGNNGVGKTSLMHYIISICHSMIEDEETTSGGIVVFRQGKNIYYHILGRKKIQVSLLKIGVEEELRNIGYNVEMLNFKELKAKFEKVKMIYLTNAISYADYKRQFWPSKNRFSPLYDCSIGGLLYCASASDINYKLRQQYNRGLEFVNYYTYEKYRQVKFVFDKNQYKNLEELNAEGYRVPKPNKLYINLYLDNQLRYFVEKETQETHPLYEWDRILFPKEVEKIEHIILLWKQKGEADVLSLLRYQFCRCCIWAMIRSIVRGFDEILRTRFWIELLKWEEKGIAKDKDFLWVTEKIWEFCLQFVADKNKEMESQLKEFERQCKQYYIDFINFILTTNLEEHFLLEGSAKDIWRTEMKEGVIRISVFTSDVEWFVNFLEKYRYTSNPDYYLDFDWGLSSGETNLLNMFALLYCIFPMDYTNRKNGPYKIYNEWEVGKHVPCDSVILMVDEADLTFHPEWQREYIALLTAFLTKVYPEECCEHIQIILSTHSPILLSDIPQQNVMYLKSNAKGQVEVSRSADIPTFGQNIHLLYRESFFLSKGTMGRFAHDKIEKCFETLENLSKNCKELSEISNKSLLTDKIEEIRQELDEQRNFIMIIAEPIIKKKLLLKVEEIEQKLLFDAPKEGAQIHHETNFIEKLSDERLEILLEQLKEEKDRRGNDKNSDV